MGIGLALLESSQLDDQGRQTNPHLLDYKLVTAADAPTSPRCSKFSANASLNRLNFASQVPSIFTAMICLLASR